jgi:multidrug efflux system outer membrane protein
MKPGTTAAASLALLVGACTVGPDFRLPAPRVADSWKSGPSGQAMRLPDEWWRLFEDAELTRLVSRSLQANNDLAAAKARVDTARALTGLDRARMFPTLSFQGGAGISRSSESATFERLPPGIDIDLEMQRYHGSFDLAYDPDLWGRNRRSLEASVSDALASSATLDAQRLAVATETARQYFLLRGLDQQEEVLRETIRSRSDTLRIQQSRADAGLIDGLTTSQAKTELELANNDLALVQRQRGAAENALAVLCGTSPTGLRVAASSSTRSLPAIRTSPPAEVLARRPDVRAAELTLRATNARVGVAQADFYPSFRLGASSGLESVKASDFLDWQNRVLSLGIDVNVPVFDAGTNRAKLRAALASRDESLANYRTTLLTALREVEDAVTDIQGLSRSRKALQAALASATDTRRLANERFERGLNSYLEVIEADRTILRVRLVLAQNDAQHRISLALLAKALGGGWAGK